MLPQPETFSCSPGDGRIKAYGHKKLRILRQQIGKLDGELGILVTDAKHEPSNECSCWTKFPRHDVHTTTVQLSFPAFNGACIILLMAAKIKGFMSRFWKHALLCTLWMTLVLLYFWIFKKNAAENSMPWMQRNLCRMIYFLPFCSPV
ncbi:uncharacterized protein LOC118183368 [Stegodyphus dumicola]|uniref:uncharacterized protein LOC118183368 n=1 Tax=Stegodyphus dumicola TaxID=202533 RepID=UPI0015A9F6C8|nr:uncharacterized protein LOC118183368 [Stegodyphus dumicola]